MNRWLSAGAIALTTACAADTTPPAAGTTAPAETAPMASADEEQAVRDAAAAFYGALNVLFIGDAGPMKAVWSHADDVTYMGPAGGLRKGWAEVGAEWDAQAALKLGGEVHPDEMQVTVGRDLALTANWERGENVGADGQPVTVSIRATNVFRREGGGWKMIGHHTDLLPHLAQP